jgi:P27 family predicted phage terminase small subunit
MAARGPKPKPKLIEQTRARLATDSERCAPLEVTADPLAVVAWERTVEALEAVGLFHRADRAMISRYATLTGVYLACLDDIRSRGMTMTTKTGYEAPSPAATHLLKIAGTLTAIEASLGLTPRARAGMKVMPPNESDDEDEALLRTYTG